MTEQVTYRPGSPRIVVYAVAVVICVFTAFMAVALPDYVVFHTSEVITMALILLAVLVGLHGIGRSFVKVTDDGLEVLNGYRRHHLRWSEMRGISMNAGAPWPTLVLKDDVHADGERVILFALQGSDGPATRAAVEDLVRRIDSHG